MPIGASPRGRAVGPHCPAVPTLRGGRGSVPASPAPSLPAALAPGSAPERMRAAAGGEGGQLPKDHLAPRYNRAIKGLSAFQRLGTSCSLTPRGF